MAGKGCEGDAGGGVQALTVGEFRGVVVFGEVAEEDMPQPVVAELTNGLGAFRVGQVAVAAADARLQVGRIWAVPEHIRVVVALYHHRVRLAGIGSLMVGLNGQPCSDPDKYDNSYVTGLHLCFKPEKELRLTDAEIAPLPP